MKASCLRTMRFFRTLMILALPLSAFAGPPLVADFTTSVREINPDKVVTPLPHSIAGGRINRLAMAPDQSLIYAASEWGGLYISADSGEKWYLLKNHRPKATWDVAVHPLHANIVYATSFYDGRVNSQSGINVSTDAGLSWTRVQIDEPEPGFCSPSILSEPSAFGIAFDPDHADRIYIGTICGLARTNDGVNWNLVDPSPDDQGNSISDVVVHHNGIIDVVGFDGHSRSTDQGDNWTTIEQGFTLPSSSLPTITASPDEPDVLFISAGTSIYESANGGQSWTQIDPPGKAQGRIPFVKVNDREGSLFDLWYGDVGLYRVEGHTPLNPGSGGQSRLDENSWQGPFITGGHADVGDLLFQLKDKDSCPILFANDGGVHIAAQQPLTMTSTTYVSPACQSPTWIQPERSPHALWLYALAGYFPPAPPPEFTLLAGTQDNGAIFSSDAEENKPTWHHKSGGDIFDIIAGKHRQVYLQCCREPPFPKYYSRILISTLTSTLEINTYPPGKIRSWHYGDNIARYDEDAYVAVTSAGVFITPDITQNPVEWTELGDAPVGQSDPPLVYFPKRFGIKVSKDQGKPVFFLQMGKLDLKNSDQIFRYEGLAANGTWEQIQPPGGFKSTFNGFSVYDVHPRDPDLLIASHVVLGLQPKMMRTLNGGDSWEAMPGLDDLMTGGGSYKYRNRHGPLDFHKGFRGYPQPSLVAFDPAGTGIVVAGAQDTGMFISADAGFNWRAVSNQVLTPGPGPVAPLRSTTPHISRPHFAVFKPRFETPLSRYLYIFAGTQGRGVFRIGAKVPKGGLVNICDIWPDLCNPIPKWKPEIVVFSELPGQIFTIALNKLCPEEGACPGCALTQTCPPHFNLHLDGLDPETWEVGLYTGGERGGYVSQTLFRTEKGVTLSFKPEREDYVEGRIGDYELALTRIPGGKPGQFRFQYRLQVSDEPSATGGVAEQF